MSASVSGVSRLRVMVVSILVLLIGSVSIRCRSADPRGQSPRVEFKEIRAFPMHSLAYGEPWSPIHERLVLLGGDGYSVFDAEHPNDGLRQVFSGAWVRRVAWSPDGDWLLLVIGDPSPPNTRMLVVVPWQGGSPDTLVRDVSFLHSTWASDGNVAYVVGSDIHWIKPPRGASPRPRGSVDVPTLLASQWIRPGRPKGEPLETQIPGSHTLTMDSVPGLGRYLVRGIGADMPTALVLDEHGTVVSDLGAAGIPFQPTGLSGDGELVVGHKTVDDGHTMISSRLFVCSSDGRWSARVENVEAGINPCFARTGRTIAFEDPHTGVRVGILSLDR
jgi:hypothetical protein